MDVTVKEALQNEEIWLIREDALLSYLLSTAQSVIIFSNNSGIYDWIFMLSVINILNI